MEKAIEKLGIYDLIGIIAPGIISTLCIIYLCPDLLSYFKSLFCDKRILDCFFIGVSYIIGLALHEIGSVAERKWLLKNGEPHEIFLNPDANIIENKTEFELFSNTIKQVLKELGFKHHNPTPSNEEVRMAFHYCQVINEMNGRNIKSDRIDSLHCMSRALFVFFFAAFVLYSSSVLIFQYPERGKVALVNVLLLLFITLVMYRRTLGLAKYQVKSVVRNYIASKSK